MKRLIVLPAIVLMMLSALSAAAPEPTDGKARARLEALKKRLPGIMAAWAKERWYRSSKVEVRLVRRTGPAEARVILLSHHLGSDGRANPEHDEVLTVYLRYFEGAWTTTRFEATWSPGNHYNNRATRFLMLAIDESEGK